MLQEQECRTLTCRLIHLEQEVQHINDELNTLLPLRESALQRQEIKQTLAHLEQEVDTLTRRIEQREQAIEASRIQQQEARAALQIKALWAIVSFIIISGSGIFTGYVTHFFR